MPAIWMYYVMCPECTAALHAYYETYTVLNVLFSNIIIYLQLGAGANTGSLVLASQTFLPFCSDHGVQRYRRKGYCKQ